METDQAIESVENSLQKNYLAYSENLSALDVVPTNDRDELLGRLDLTEASERYDLDATSHWSDSVEGELGDLRSMQRSQRMMTETHRPGDNPRQLVVDSALRIVREVCMPRLEGLGLEDAGETMEVYLQLCIYHLILDISEDRLSTRIYSVLLAGGIPIGFDGEGESLRLIAYFSA